MGRPRKPLSEQAGNLTQAFQNQRRFEEQLLSGSAALPKKPPDWLLEDAKPIWKKLIKKMKALPLLCDLDEANVGGFCNSKAMYDKVTAELENQPLMVLNGDKLVENPLIATQLKYAKDMRDFGAKCGLNPDSRLKLAAEKTQSIDDNIADTFGAI